MARREPKGPPTARALAITVLARVCATDAYLNVVLDTVLGEHAPPGRDAGLVTELCYGATRRQLWLDAALERFLDRKLSALEDRVLAALRIGAYQLFFLRTPTHAAVGDTVEAVKELGLARAAGFCNAVLRKLAQAGQPPLPAEPWALRWSLAESHPRWLVERWQRQYGTERAEAMLTADNVAPPVVVRVNAAQLARDELVERLREVGVAAAPTALSPVGVVLPPSGRVADLLGYDEGWWQVQDEAAQLVGVFAQVPEGARVLDACAAPGGKACHLAERCNVVAVDLHPSKLPKIEAEARRLRLAARLSCQALDATLPIASKLGQFDAVLADAPCSGLGTLRRHPELRYRRKEEDLSRLAALQRRILERCAEAVRPGGLLIYAVCSTDLAEGLDQMEPFLRSHPEFTSEPPELPGLALPTSQGFLRTLPGPERLDGFFAARLRKAT